MRRQYYGKICPYCKTPLKEGDVIAVCGACDMPHHLSCWQANQSCTTFGCSGTIREIIGLDTPTPAPPGTDQSVPYAPPHSPSGHSERATPWRAEESVLTETLYQNNDPILMTDLPLLLEQTAVIIDRTRDKLFAHCSFRNLSPTPIEAALVEIACQDVWGSDLGDPVPFQYLDLKAPRNGQFGQSVPVELPDKNARRIRLMVKKLLLADGTIFNGSGETTLLTPQALLTSRLDRALLQEFASQTTVKARFLPDQVGAYRRCTCGSYHTEEICPTCGCTWDKLFAALDVETLRAGIAAKQAAAEAQRIAREKAQAEQAERIRQAEEQVRREQEAREQALREEQAAQELARKKKRKKKRIILLLVSLVLVAALGVFIWLFGIPCYHYFVARDALKNQQFSAAYEGFIALDGFLDSEEWAMETRYLEAMDALENGHYDDAYTIFTKLGDYKDSDTQAKESRYQKALYHYGKENYGTAVTIFSALGDYKDSPARLQESQYHDALQMMGKNHYASAYKIFKDLGSYSDSQNQLTNCIYAWADYILSSGTANDASAFQRAVSLSSTHHSTIYSKILNKIRSHTSFDYWDDGWNGTSNATVVYTMLQTLPSYYQDTENLLKIFEVMSNGSIHPVADYIRENGALLKSLWSYAFIQDFLKTDEMIVAFLEGYWYGSGYYLQFIKQEDGRTWSQFDLPWVAKPYGTKYYDIESLIYYWDGEDNNHLAKVFRFEIVDFDTIRVFCYSNNRTYTMYRS